VGYVVSVSVVFLAIN